MIISITQEEKNILQIISTLKSNLEKNWREIQSALTMVTFQLQMLERETQNRMSDMGKKYGFDPSIKELNLNLEMGVIQIPDEVKHDKD